MEIELEFEHDGETYRVRRGFSKSKATLDFDAFRPAIGDWRPESRESVRETQALIEQTLGLSRATFNASAFLAQGNSAAFCEAVPSDRKAILGEILDPRELWPRLAMLALSERKITETELQINQTKIAEREPLAATIPDLLRSLDQAKTARSVAETSSDEAARKLEAALAAQAQNAAAVGLAQAALQEHAAATREEAFARRQLEEANEAAGKLPMARTQISYLAETINDLPNLELLEQKQRDAAADRTLAMQKRRIADLIADELARSYRSLASTAKTLEAQAGDTGERVLRLLEAAPGQEHCALCHQTLGIEAREATIASLREETSLLTARAIEARTLADEADQARAAAEVDASMIEIPKETFDGVLPDRLAKARQAAQEHAGLAVRIQGYEDASARLAEHTQAHIDAKQKLLDAAAALELAHAAQIDPETLADKTAAARLTASNRRVDLDEAAANVTRIETEYERAKTAALELAELANTGALIHQRLDLLRLAERATGRDGIPALIAENAADVIEAEANRILERMPTSSGSVFRVELRTQRALKGDASAIRETLDILVSDRQSTREFATFSGGERFRVAFALRWSLARLLAGRRGAESRLLVIDEPDGLDAGGMDGLASVLREERGGFAKILVVSHNPLLASSFEQVLEITSDGEVSRIEEDSLMGVTA